MSTGAHPPTQLFVVASGATARMRMRIVPVVDDGERVAAVNQGLGIVPLEVMAEGDDAGLVENVVAELCAAIGRSTPSAAEPARSP